MSSPHAKLHLLVVPVFAGGAILIPLSLLRAFATMRGIALLDIPALNWFLISVPAVTLWTPMTLIVSNLLLQVIPPLRRIAIQSAVRTTQEGFWQMQAKTLRMTAWYGLACVPLIVLGFLAS